MKLTNEQKATIEAKTYELLQKGAEEYNIVVNHCDIVFDIKGTHAGEARINSGKAFDPYNIDNAELKIRYNEVLAAENFDKFLETTVPHEVAHIVAEIYNIKYICEDFYRFRPVKHGRIWKDVMVF